MPMDENDCCEKLRELNKEISKLRSENSELRFRLDIQQRERMNFYKKECFNCGYYSGMGGCAKKGHSACLDWISTD